MADDLSEKLERLCERFGVPEPWRSRALGRIQIGRREFGPWNHLRMSPEELVEEAADELADWLVYRVLIPWSKAYHSTLVDGYAIGLAEEDADGGVDTRLVDAYNEFLSAISEGENGLPAHER